MWVGYLSFIDIYSCKYIKSFIEGKKNRRKEDKWISFYEIEYYFISILLSSISSQGHTIALLALLALLALYTLIIYDSKELK